MTETVIRTAVLYFFVIAAVRIMGKRQVGDLQPGELVITILISEIASMPISDTDMPVLCGITAMFTLVAVEIVMSWAALKLPVVRRMLSGRSAIIIRDGVIDKKALHDLRITVTDLSEVLRGKDVFDIGTVAWAILETNGSLSVLLKSECQPADKSDIGKADDVTPLSCLVISDGRLCNQSLKDAGMTRNDIDRIMRHNKREIKDVFMMSADTTGNYFIITKEKK